MPVEKEIKNFISQSKLNKQELKEFLKATEKMDPKADHSLAYRIMMNETRRNLLKYIGNEICDIKDIHKEFKIKKDELRYHLSMLKQGLYVIENQNHWKSTPRGLGFLANAILE